MREFIELETSEIVSGRSFSQAEHSHREQALMNQMLGRLRSMAEKTGALAPLQPQDRLERRDDQGATHRIVVADGQGLTSQDPIMAVGFFGQIRDGMDHTPIMELENELMDRLPEHKGVLLYYNLHVPGEGYGNLVLLSGARASEDWREDPTHRLAVELTPRHYRSVRLHNGLLPGGFFGPYTITLTATKYYDFRGEKPWKAIRAFPRPGDPFI